MIIEYEPGDYISNISPTSFLLVVTGGDHLVPADIACEAHEKALEPKKLLILPGGHFYAYTGEDSKMNSSPA